MILSGPDNLSGYSSCDFDEPYRRYCSGDTAPSRPRREYDSLSIVPNSQHHPRRSAAGSLRNSMRGVGRLDGCGLSQAIRPKHLYGLHSDRGPSYGRHSWNGFVRPNISIQTKWCRRVLVCPVFFRGHSAGNRHRYSRKFDQFFFD